MIRSLRDGVAPVLPEAPRASRRMTVITFVGIVVFAGFAAFGLTPRARDARAGPDDHRQRRRQRRATLDDAEGGRGGQARETTTRASRTRGRCCGTDLAAALKEYDAASQIDPKQPEPFTYIGWINALAAQQLPAGAQRDAARAARARRH